MTLTIIIETDNAAFEDRPATEISRILRRIAADYAHDGTTAPTIKYLNGNTVGFVREDR